MKSVELLEYNMGVKSYPVYVDCLPSSVPYPIPREGAEETEYDWRLNGAFSTATGSCF